MNNRINNDFKIVMSPGSEKTALQEASVEKTDNASLQQGEWEG